MSKHYAGTALLLALFATNTQAETLGHASYIDADERVVALGDSGWELFRPARREQTPFDLTYLTHDLVSRHAGIGLRFHSSRHLTIDLETDPFARDRSLVAPIYDVDIGATTLALRFSF